MVPEQLEPCLELLREEHVLVQAWKKTASYIRYHNWFSDTLALDRAAVNLPAFLGQTPRTSTVLGELGARLLAYRSGAQEPALESTGRRVGARQRAALGQLRPLGHVSLADQVVATALMLCLADRVETLQGDPRQPIGDQQSRRQVVSYGNRLYCAAGGREGGLRHRWGSAKLYRVYYQDYRAFLSRPEVAAESIPAAHGKRIYVVDAAGGAASTRSRVPCNNSGSPACGCLTFFAWESSDFLT